ncbi:MAG: hypothetical protein UX97_C0009G0024 [Candidatus Beckwithbacteria bacterium GW2011_GWA2_47_25]|nr:MAG: hypothetical protein UX97_C0009G0024 [Candidatus Beckwithbacteria bacterium GW2011_GWA2_47_25]
MRLSIHPEKGLTVRAPFWVPEISIRKFIQDKAVWIEKHLSRSDRQTSSVKQYLPGEKHLYFGQEYDLDILYLKTPRRTEVKIHDDKIQVSLFEGHVDNKRTNEIKEAILRFYLETGIAIITEKVNHYSGLLGVEYSRIDIKKVSSIWGSCSPTNRLSFNRKLIMAPHEVVDYVIIHEVCHLVQRNHSSRFWGLVAKFDPKYKEHRRWLHRNHQKLLV